MTRAFKALCFVLALLSIFTVVDKARAASSGAFECEEIEANHKNDEKALALVKEKLFGEKKDFDISCIQVLVRNNLFQTNNFLMSNYFYKKDQFSNEDMMEQVRLGIGSINRKYDQIIDTIHDELKKPIVLSPPFHWGQSLSHLEFEIKYAYRFDVAGCADLFNETYKVTKDVFYVGASCKELDQTMFFQLHFKLWDEVDPDSIKIEKRPVGKVYIQLIKLTQPARWKQLWLEETPKPDNMRIWFEKLQNHYSSLSNFEDDDIEDFAGHDLIEEEEDETTDDNTWLFPPKGPGEFKKLRNKKKKAKKGKKTKKKKSKKTDL